MLLRKSLKIWTYVFLLLSFSGCGKSSSTTTPLAFRFPPVKVGESAEEKVLIRHHGSNRLAFANYKIQLTNEYQLDWCTVDSKTGKSFGPPRIAGFHKGRVVFPNVLDLLPGQDLLLMLKYSPTGNGEPSGKITMESNDTTNPKIEIDVTFRR